MRSGTGRTWRVVAGIALVAIATAACGGGTDGASTGRLRIVATTSVMGDLASQVAGDAAAVEVLIPVGADPHEFQVSSQQAASVQEADLVVAVGLGLEQGLFDLLAAAANDGTTVLEIGPQVDPLPFGAHAAPTSDDDHTDGFDPHVWMDPVRMEQAARIVGDALQAIDPSGDWDSRAEAYAAQLEAADAEIASLVATIPQRKRTLVTNHDALGYFAARYDFEVVGVIVPGGSTLGSPSSAELAALVDVLREREVPAIFAETIEPATLADAIAAEVGAQVKVVELYTGSLGEPGSGADTLAGMLVTDARRIVDALS